MVLLRLPPGSWVLPAANGSRLDGAAADGKLSTLRDCPTLPDVQAEIGSGRLDGVVEERPGGPGAATPLKSVASERGSTAPGLDFGVGCVLSLFRGEPASGMSPSAAAGAAHPAARVGCTGSVAARRIGRRGTAGLSERCGDGGGDGSIGGSVGSASELLDWWPV